MYAESFRGQFFHAVLLQINMIFESNCKKGSWWLRMFIISTTKKDDLIFIVQRTMSVVLIHGWLVKSLVVNHLPINLIFWNSIIQR